MARKINDGLIDNAIELISSGKTLKFAASEIGVHPETLSRKLKDRGFKIPKSIKPNIINIPIDEVVSMYQGGESENAIAKHFKTSRTVIRKRIIDVGISPRTQSEAEKLKWSKMTEEQRIKQTKNAHNAVRGSIQPDSVKIATAITREKIKHGCFIGIGEVEFSEILSHNKISFRHQKAIKFYNVDFAIGNIAVELTVDRTRYSSFNPREIKRAEDLLKCGYHVLAIQFTDVQTLINCSNDIIRFINEMQRLDASISEYWVISCRKQTSIVRKNNLGQFSSVPTPVKFITKRSIVQL